jgi:hypothetical protein
MTKAEILKDTIQYYNADPNRRAVNRFGSFIRTEDGKLDPAGRKMKPSSLDALKKKNLKIGIHQISQQYDGLDNLLLPEYRGYPIEFWEHLQELHDKPSHWSDAGITLSGLYFVDKICVTFEIEVWQVLNSIQLKLVKELKVLISSLK